MKQLFFAAAYLFFFTLALLHPDSFRVSTIYTCFFDSEVFEPVTLTLGYNDAVAFRIKQAPLFLEGIELEIKQNKTAYAFPNSIAYSLYTGIDPAPARHIIDYSARKLTAALLPNRFSHTIRIPVKSHYTFTSPDNGELLPYEHTQETDPLMLRFSPIMKGLPEEFETAGFTVVIRPLLIAEGGLRINLRYPAGEQKPVMIRLNNEYLNGSNTLQLVPPGTHLVSLSSDDYRHEVRSCIIERGKITELNINLQSIIPLLHIRAPENVTVLLDDQELPSLSRPLPVQAGTHIVTFKAGSYELTRQISLESGKTYNLTMTMDVLFQETGE
ncbi:MAG: hypothetical protein P1P65_08490 [Treponema sp.]